MNKYAFFGLLILFAQTTNAFDINIKDENFRNCLALLAEKNHWQSPADVTAIECHNQHIVSLDGVEQFINLQTLSLYNNDIVEMPNIHLAKLNQLNLAKNKLKTFSMNGLPALETLYIFGNRIQILTLENLPALKILKANNNLIDNFVYSNLPQLEKLYLFDNIMPTIDIYHLPKMNYMDVRQSPMTDQLYEEMDKLKGVTFLHNGNSRDWK